MRIARPVVFVLACVAGPALGGSPESAPPAAKGAPSMLPAAATAALDAFRAVTWGDRCKPIRAEPAPEGWQVRVKAQAALASLDAKDRPTLTALLGDADRFVRALAARAVGLHGSADDTPALAEALAAEKDKLARIAMIEALGRTGGPAALAAVEAQQQPGVDADISWMVGLARRQLKGQRWDVENLRAEFAEAARAPFGKAEKGKEAPELALPSPGKPVNLAPYKGRVVVLAFTHGDRDPVAEKALQRLTMEEERFARLDVQFIVVDPHEKERTAIWQQKVRLPSLVFASDPAGRAAATYGLASQVVAGGEWQPSPAWFVIDKKGRIAWSKIGRQQSDCATLGELLPVLEDVAHNVVVK